MKRFVYVISVLLLSFALRAQEATYTCRYWFDQNHVQAVTTTFGTSGWEAELDVGQLAEGLHALHLHVLAENAESRFGMEGDSLYRLADTTLLKWTAPQTYLFLKVGSIPNEEFTYHYWFDQDHAAMQSGNMGSGHLLLDVADLEEGLHTVHVMLEGGALTPTQSYMFLKMPVEDPSMALQYHCWFDQDYANVQTGLVGSGLVELEVSNLPNGIHTVNVQLDNGSLTAPKTYLFYKQPLGGYDVARWEYWLNEDFDNRNTTLLSPTIDSLSIVSLLSVGHPDIRSSCFHFHPNGDNPYINAKNQITFRIWDSEMRFFDKSAMFVDEHVQQDIVAHVFERNTTEGFAAPRNNQIQWFKLDAVVGDSLSFVASKACTMQLFAPSGEEVFNVSGPESIALGGLHAWEDGTYYLAVHDMTGSGETVSVTYNWVYRYAVMAYDVHLVGNGGCSTITFQGNGFNSLLGAYLVNAQNDTIHRLDIGHESNTTTTVTFNFYEVNLGVYDAVFQFYDETIRINGALEVQEPVDIVLTSSVSYPSQFLRNTACTYSFTITNEGNMTAYSVPIYIYISTKSVYDITNISIEEMKVQSYYDCVKDLYEWSEFEKKNLKDYSDFIGIEYCFMKSVDIDENGIDSVLIRSGNFFLEIPPYSTRTLTLRLTSSNSIGTWFSCPNDWLPGMEQRNRLSFDGINRSPNNDYCCWHDDLENILNGIGNTMSVVSTGIQMVAAATMGAAAVTGAAAALPTPATPALAGAAAVFGLTAAQLTAWATGIGLVGCASGYFANLSSEIANELCDRNLSIGDRIISWGGLGASCASAVLPAGLGSYSASAIGLSAGIYSMGHNKKNPECTDDPPKGGESTPVNSLDPNDIHGYLSESGSHFMRQKIQNVQYEIEFENDTTLATAAAHTIIVRDTLDASKFDLNSVAARSVTIGDKRLELNGEQTFARTLDMRPELYVIAQIEQDYDPNAGIIEWTIQSLDPMTMEPTNDPNQGVLPVNYTGNGVGFIDYSVNLKQTFDDGTEISNRAGIIFDQEEVIMTPTWTNIVDAVKPTSHIESAEMVNDSLVFSVVSEDNRSGVWYHSLYYRNDSTAMEWQVKKAQAFGNEFKLRFDDFQTTEYLVMAIDSAGNREEKDMLAEYIYYYDGPTPITQCEDLLQGWTWFAPMVSSTIDEIQDALGMYHENILSEHERTSNDIVPGEMLKIETNAGCTLNLTGVPFTTAAVEINQGTNWFGYIGTEKPVGEVFNDTFGPNEGDKIISQDGGFAIFNGTLWQGTLETLQPGHGYVYYSTANAPKTLLMGQ